MTTEEVASAISAYGAGLEAELSLLRQLQRLSEEQREATLNDDVAPLPRIADERERVMAGLVEIEHQVKPIRQAISAVLAQAVTVPGFEDVVALHRAASRLVSRIMSSDEETVQALRDAEVARRFASQTIERGESTLAAYRRVVAPPLASAAIVDRRG